MTKVKSFDMRKLKYILIENAAAIVMILLILYNVAFTSNFAQTATLNNILIQMTATTLIGLGMTWVIATGGIDISVGAVMAVASMVSAKLLWMGAAPAIIGGIVAASLIGLAIGLIIGKFGIQPMIVTLPFMLGMRGFAQILNNNKILRFSDEAYVVIGKGKVFGNIPIQLFILLAAIIVMMVITNRTTFGRKIEAAGDNIKGATLSGINTFGIILVAYTTIAFFSGVAGVIETARIASSDANSIGLQMELDAIAAVAIGGTPMTGGKPKIMGTVYGAIIIQLITTMVSMNDIKYEYALVLKAAIIIIALVMQRFLNTRKEAIS